MTFNRVSPVCLCLCLAILIGSADAQNQAAPSSAGYVGDSTGFASAGDFNGSYLLGNDGGTYFLFDKLVGDGPGFDTGYSRFGLRAKLFDSGDSHLWGSGYALITDDTRVGVNVGGGYRWLFDSNIIGVHGWFDSYETNNGNRYDQITAGFELLHEDVDLRVNGYYPLDDTETFLGVTDPGTTSVFTSRGIGFLGRGLEEQALKGIDAEIGTAIFAVNWARIYGGGYWYDGANTSFGGFRGRVETAISPDLSLNFMVQNDTEFDTNYNLSVEYRFSGGMSPGFFTPFHGANRKYNPVRRQWPVATQIVDVATTVPMLNPKTGRIMTAAFVDNRNPDAGDGSYENPFRELPSSVIADKVFVFAGTPGSPTKGNITLQPNQQLLGEGMLYTFDDPLRGTVRVPEVFRASGPAPILMAANPTQNVVTLSNWNFVSKFDVAGAAAAAVGGANIEDFAIYGVRGFDQADGVHIVNASGTGVIEQSGFRVTDQGIFVSSTTGPGLDLTIEGAAVGISPFGAVTSVGGREGVHIAADGADIDLHLTNVRTDNTTETGIILDASLGATLTARGNEVRAFNSGGVSGGGFALNVASGGSMGINLTNISAAGSDDLFVVDVRDGEFFGTVGGGVPGIIPGARFEGSTTGSGVRINLDDATGRLHFENLYVNGNAVNAVETRATGDGTNFVLEVIDSQGWGNIGSGFKTSVLDGADFRYFLDPSFAMQNGGSGFEFDVRGPGSVFIADIIQTNFNDSGLHAIDGNVFNGAFANVDLVQSPGQNAGLSGYHLNVDRNATFIGTIDEGNFNFAGDAALDLTVSDNSSASLVVTNTDGHNNGDYGIRFLVDDGVNGPSDLFLSVADGDFNSNPDSNIHGTVRGPGSLAAVYLNRVTASGFANNGAVVLNAEDGGILNTNWTTGTASQSAGTGIIANVDGAGSQIRLNLNGISIGTNSGDGINASITNGGPGSLLNLTLVNSGVTNNQGSGVVLTADGPGAMSNVLFDNSPVSGNFWGDGFRFDISGGAGLLASASGLNATFSGNGESGWDGTVSGAGSYASLFFDGADALSNGLEGGVFNVTAGGLLNLNLANLSIAENPLDGLLTTVDGPLSRANIVMDQVTMTRNGLSLLGDAFEARATGGGLIVATLSNLNVTENREDAFLFDASTGGIIRTRMDNILADNNGRHGLEFHASSGGQFEGVVTASSFSNDGGVFIANGVYGTANGVGSLATATFDGVVADNNSRMGFEFDVREGATLLADIRSALFGNSSGSGNAINGVRFNAVDAGTMGFLKMMGPNTFDGNIAGDGINFDAVGVNMAVANVTGTVNSNGADGINIRMINVNQGAISLQGAGAATITGNAGDGIDITTQNVNLADKTINGMLIPDFQIDGFSITANGGEPIVVNLVNTTFQDGEITNNEIDGGLDGINVNLGSGTGDMLIDGNTITNAQRYGIAVTSGAGTHKVTITNNTVISSGDTNIFVDLFGTTETGLMINDNEVIGGGTGTPMFTTGLNFTGSTSGDSGFIPPDTMGGVGPDHVVELINGTYAVYDKTTGAQLLQTSLDAFFTNAGLPQGTGGVRFDPRIIFDPTVNRWFAVGIDGGTANQIFVAVSLTDNPLDGFQGVSFVGDTVDGSRFNDFVTLGIDANSITLGTNNFGGPAGFDVSIFSIPKADLLGPVPTLANLTRLEALDSNVFGETPQGVVDFGPAEPFSEVLGNPLGGGNLFLTNLQGAGTPTATIANTTNVAVPLFLRAPDARQPAAPPLENVTPEFNGNVIEVNDSIWAVHAVLGSTGNSAIRWYQIDSATGTVQQTGLIEDPNVDYLDASIAVNPVGAVVVGFTGSGPGQNPSSMAAFGATDAGGLTTFQAPQVLQLGNSSYFEDFGSGRNRWGDYSATVVDPSDPNTFWTFQEFAVGPSTWGVQITEISFTQAFFGGTLNDGIHVDVRENAHLTDSMINGNTITNHGGDAIEVVVSDTARVDDLQINGNNAALNGGDGVRFEATTTGPVGSLDVSGNSVTENSGDGIDVLISGVAGAPDIMVNSNTVSDNLGRGIAVSAVDTAVGDVSISMNTVSGNLGGNGITLDLDNMTGGALPAGDIMLIGNNVSGSAGDGVNINLNDRTGVDLLDVSMSNVSENMGGGIVVTALDTPIGTGLFDLNTIVDNTGGDGLLLDLTNSGVGTLTISRSSISTNSGEGVELDLDGSPIGTLNVLDNNSGGTASNIGLTFLVDGPTFGSPFTLLNSSAAGTDITGFMLDVSTAVPNPLGGIVFDTELTGAPIPFTPQAGTDVLTGLATVNGVAVVPGTNPLEDTLGNILPGGGIPDMTQLIDLTFNDFNSAEVFQWIIDLDFSTAPGSAVSGNDLINSTIRVDFTGGSFLTGALLGIPGNPDASTFVATGGTPTGAAGLSGNLGNGFLLNATNGSHIGAITMDNNIVNGNSIHGVNFLVSDSTLPAVGGTGVISNNEISGHANGDGFRLINPDTNGTPFELNFVDNTVIDNGTTSNGVGVNIELNANSGGMTSTFTGNEISDNGSIGASFVLTETANLDLTFGDSAANANVIDNNVDAGIAIKTKDMSTATVVVENTTVSNTTDGANLAFNGDGLAVHSSGSSIIRSLTIGDETLANTSFVSNAGNGIDIELTDSSRNPNILIQNAVANSNTIHGIGITRTGFSTFTEDLDSDGILDPGEDVNNDGGLGNAMITLSTANGNGGNGLEVFVTGAQLPVQQIDVMLNQNSFNNNTIGMNYTVNNDAILLVNASNNIVSGNSLHGISVTTNQNAAFGNVLPSGGNPNSPLAIPSTFSSNIVTNNGSEATPGNGFNFVANNNSVQAIVVDDAGAVNPSTGTSRTVIDGNRGNQVQITGNGNSQQTIDLTAVNITNVNNAITGDGVNIDANGNSTLNVSISGGASGPGIIGAAIAHVSVPGLGGPGGAVSNGIAADVANQAILNLDVSNISLFNNTGDGIVITNQSPGGLNGSDAGFSGGNRQTIQANFDNVNARLNGDRGLDVQLVGNVGGRAAQGDTDLPILINVTNSNFSTNTNEGIFFQTNTGFTQDHEIQIVNPAGPAQSPLFNTINGAGGGRDVGGFTNGFNQATRAGQFNVSRYDGVDLEWNNLYADLVATFNVVNSTIQTNGTASISDGLVMRVSTNSYVGSRIVGNTFGANGGDDFHTESFITTDAAATPQLPSTSIDNPAGFDSVFLDDTAQVDLSFQQNAGDHIRVSALGAFYTNADPAKQATRPNGPTNRRGDIFILDNGLTVDPNNNFQSFGIPQMEVFGPDGFSTNGYFVRPGSNHLDPNFPPP